MSLLDDSCISVQGCAMFTSTPIRGSSAHKQPCSSNYEDNNDQFSEDGLQSTEEQDCLDVQLSLSDEPVEQIGPAPRFTSKLAMRL